MYFPKRFSIPLAMEIGGLVTQAYEQFAAFEAEQPWSLSGGYRMAGEINYGQKVDSGLDGLGIDLRKLLGLKKREVVSVPIGFIAEGGGRTFVIFRGTKTPKEWVNNFSINLKSCPVSGFGSVHDGFLDMYGSAKDDLAKALAQAGGKSRLYIGGHSLGAAMATLAMADIEVSLGRAVAALYTFGSPRVGDAAFAAAFNARFAGRSFRVANSSDIVTSIPLPIPIVGPLGGYFSHVDTPVDFSRQDNDIEANHAMKTYLAELEKAGSTQGFFARLFGGRS
jgi:triacylglycerol lipase